MKYFLRTTLFLFLFFTVSIASAATTETYENACATAKTNFDAAGTISNDWLADSSKIVTIPAAAPSADNNPHGLIYDSAGNVVVRTAASYASFLSSYTVGPTTFRTDKPPTADSAAWVTTGNELTTLLKDNGVTAANVISLVERGIGVNTTGSGTPHNVMIEYSVIPDDNHLMRPTKNPDIATYDKSQYGNDDTKYPFIQPAGMSDAAYANFCGGPNFTANGFYQNHRNAVYPDPPATAYPWTQLGYTYFWGKTYTTYPPTTASQILGMSEFVILPQTAVNVYGIYTTKSYIYTQNDGTNLSAASTAQYGNGFASFDVTGDCDSIWAGSRFQANTKTDSSTPNTITIETLGTVSGQQGILVWSLNYNVTNKGTISGPTAAKFGLAGTDNVAILFEGDTNAAYGTPVTSGVNKLTNMSTGSISSGGAAPIAVEVVNGNTEITNAGNIYTEGAGGDSSYSIWLQAGTNTITNSSYIGKLSDNSKYSETGILIDSGSTTITNNTGGVIYGNTCAIQLAGGTNTINNYAKITSPGTAIQIDAGTAAVTNIGGTISGDVVLANDPTAALDIGNNPLAIAGDYIQGANATLKTTISSTSVFGTLTADGISNASSKMNVIVGCYIPNNTIFTNVLTDTTNHTVSLPGTINSSSPVLTFTGVSDPGHTYVDLTATRTSSYQSFTSNASASAAGSALNALAMNGTATGDMRTLLGALDSLTSASQINQALNSLTPNTNNSVPQVSYETQGQFINTVLSHFDNVPFIQTAGDAGARVLGNDERKMGVWAQGFDTYLHQDPRGLSNGYDANVWGTSIGYDVPVLDNFICGFNTGFAWNNIRTKDNSARTTADNYEGSLYGSYSREACYVDAILSFAYNQYDSSRHVAFAGIDRMPTSKYGGQEYSAYLESGYTFKNHKVALTPFGSAQYAHLYVNNYTEENGGAADLQVNSQDSDMFQTGLGARLSYKISGKDYTLIPDLHVKWLYDFIGDNQQATSTFTGGGASFATNGFTPAQSSYDFGTRLVLLSKAHVTVTLNYDFELKEDFYSHAGYGNVRYDF